MNEDQFDVISDDGVFLDHSISDVRQKKPYEVDFRCLTIAGIEAMQQISMVGNDLKLDNGVGVCGKEGQSLPVGVGQPTLKVDNLTVGGTA